MDDGYTYPDVSALVKVTIDEVMMMDEGMDKEMDEKDEMMSDKDDKMMSDDDGMMIGQGRHDGGRDHVDGRRVDTPYTVVAGDTLGSISRRAYGASKYWSVICSANELADCNLIHIGDELMLPSHAGDAMSMMEDKMMMGEKDSMMSDDDKMTRTTA